MIVAPIKKHSNFSHLKPGTENSDTIISEQPIYTKVPAAKLEKITSTSSPALAAGIPIPIPNGVAKEKIVISYLTSLKLSGNALTRLIPRDEPAAPL